MDSDENTFSNEIQSPPKPTVLPPPATPPLQTSTSTYISSPIPQDPNASPVTRVSKKRFITVIFIIFLVLFFLLSSVSIFAYFVATDKIDIKNDSIKYILSKIVFQIPFIPKDPRFILQSSMLAHQKVSRNSFNISLAASSNDFVQQLGSNEIEFQIKGYTDFSDLKNPTFSTSIDFTNQLSLDVRKINDIIYFKINKIPVFINAYLNIEESQLKSIMANWIAYDTTPLMTEARKNLPNPTIPSPTDTASQLLENMLKEEILPYVKLTNESIDGTPTYSLKFTPTDQQLNQIYNTLYSLSPSQINPTSKPEYKISNNIKNFSFTIWINQKDFYINKSLITMNIINPNGSSSTINSSSPLSLTSKIPETAVAFVVKLSDYGVTKNIDIPQNSIPTEEYFKLIMNSSALYQNQMKSNDTSFNFSSGL